MPAILLPMCFPHPQQVVNLSQTRLTSLWSITISYVVLASLVQWADGLPRWRGSNSVEDVLRDRPNRTPSLRRALEENPSDEWGDGVYLSVNIDNEDTPETGEHEHKDEPIDVDVDDHGGLCSPLEVTGLEHCPSWEGTGVISSLLKAKKEMLRGIVRVLDDPASIGPGGDPTKPLLLVREIVVDEADAIVGAAIETYMGKVPDAGSWNPEIGGFNRWLQRYYNEVLHRSRPVLVRVHVSVLLSSFTTRSATAT